MPKFAYEIQYTEIATGVIDALNEADAEYVIERDFYDLLDLRITKIEELVD